MPARLGGISLGSMASPSLGASALAVLSRRYLLRGDDGEPVETPGGLFRRVARAVAEAEPPSARAAMADRFEARMAALEFLPNSPTLMNAGRDRGQLAACFVLPVDDDSRLDLRRPQVGRAHPPVRRRDRLLLLAPPPARRRREDHARRRERPGLVHARLRRGDRDHQAGGRQARRQHGGAARRPPRRARLRPRQAWPRARELQRVRGGARRALRGRRGGEGLAAAAPEDGRVRPGARIPPSCWRRSPTRHGRPASRGSSSSIASRRRTLPPTRGRSRP